MYFGRKNCGGFETRDADDDNNERKRWLEPMSEQDIEDAKVNLHQLSMGRHHPWSASGMARPSTGSRTCQSKMPAVVIRWRRTCVPVKAKWLRGCVVLRTYSETEIPCARLLSDQTRST